MKIIVKRGSGGQQRCVCFELKRGSVYPNELRFTAQETLMSLSKSPYLDPDLRRWKLQPHLQKIFCLSWT